MSAAAFNEWMAKVDRAVIGRVGLSVHDLADQPFWDWFEDGMEPAEAAQLALEDEGWSE